jgi:hypothetical protein
MLHYPKDKGDLPCILDHRAMLSKSLIFVKAIHGFLRMAETDAAHVACTHLTSSSNLNGFST